MPCASRPAVVVTITSRIVRFIPGNRVVPECPGCGSPAAAPVGAPFVGTVGLLWRKRAFDERLYRCAEGHVYSVRITQGREAETVTTELHESVDDWLRSRTGTELPPRPPGL
jgi:hypothetical protein